MRQLLSMSLVALFAGCAATTAAFAGIPVPVPEPSSLAVLASGVGVVYLVRKLRRKK